MSDAGASGSVPSVHDGFGQSQQNPSTPRIRRSLCHSLTAVSRARDAHDQSQHSHCASDAATANSRSPRLSHPRYSSARLHMPTAPEDLVQSLSSQSQSQSQAPSSLPVNLLPSSPLNRARRPSLSTAHVSSPLIRPRSHSFPRPPPPPSIVLPSASAGNGAGSVGSPAAASSASASATATSGLAVPATAADESHATQRRNGDVDAGPLQECDHDKLASGDGNVFVLCPCAFFLTV